MQEQHPFAMKELLAQQNRHAERLLAVHAIASATLKAAILAPSPLRAENEKRRRAIKARPPGHKANRPWLDEWADQERLALDHPSDHHPPPLATPAAAQQQGRAVTLTVRELDTLLRAAVPPGRTVRTRRAHVRVRHAIESFADALAALDGSSLPPRLIRAAEALATATDAWLAQARRAADDEAAARHRWHARARPLSIRTVTRTPATSVPDPFTLPQAGK
jgi:hypothetical protein